MNEYTLTEDGSTVWKNLGSAKQKAINLALLYGKPGSGKGLICLIHLMKMTVKILQMRLAVWLYEREKEIEKATR